MTNSATISVEDVYVVSSPFSYVQVNDFKLKLTKHSDDQDDITMDIKYDLLVGEWLPHESHDLSLSIATKNLPKDFLLKNENALHPTSSFLSLSKRHRFYSVNNEHVVISQPYVNASGATNLTIRMPAHKYSLTRITSPPIKDWRYIDEQIHAEYLPSVRPLSSKYGAPSKSTSSLIQSEGELELEVVLSGHEARKTLEVRDLGIDLRVLGGHSGCVDFALSLDKFPSLVVAKETKSQSVEVSISRFKLWSEDEVWSQTVDGRLVIYKDSNELRLEHVDKDVGKLAYLIPGYDYKIKVNDIVLNYY